MRQPSQKMLYIAAPDDLSACLQDELRESGDAIGEPACEVLQAMVASLPAAVQAAVEDGTLTMCEDGPEAEATLADNAGQVDWEGRKAVLQQQLADLQQVASWPATLALMCGRRICLPWLQGAIGSR